VALPEPLPAKLSVRVAMQRRREDETKMTYRFDRRYLRVPATLYAHKPETGKGGKWWRWRAPSSGRTAGRVPEKEESMASIWEYEISPCVSCSDAPPHTHRVHHMRASRTDGFLEIRGILLLRLALVIIFKL